MANKFINPYNFVPIYTPKGEKNENLNSSADNERITGKIVYRLTTKSPLFIPNTSGDRVFKACKEELDKDVYHKGYEFFSYTNMGEVTDNDDMHVPYTPVIPGSEIRGAVRSLYETLTDSCFSAVNENGIVSKRTPQQYIPGVLLKKSGKWQLVSAEDCVVRDSNFAIRFFQMSDLPCDGTKVRVRDISPENRPTYAKKIMCIDELKGRKEGYLLKGEIGPELPKSRGSKCSQCPKETQRKCKQDQEKRCYLLEKHCAHVFLPKNNNVVWEINSDRQEKIKKQLNQLLIFYKTEKNQEKAYEEYSKSFKTFTEGKSDGLPVYFSKIDDEHIYFSPACITKEVYEHTISDLLGVHNPCDKREQLCPACKLFGTVNIKSAITKGSQIRFSDAKLIKPDSMSSVEEAINKVLYKQPVMLPELAQPKPSATEFYLQKPVLKEGEVLLNWTYDYYVLVGKDGVPAIKWYTPTLAGRKYYWHCPEAAEKIMKGYKLDADPEKRKKQMARNKTVRPVKKDSVFEGTVFFDNISSKQLEQIIAIMDMSNNTNYAIKLGAAKPFGFGSVALNIEQVSIRKISTNKETKAVAYVPDQEFMQTEKRQGITEELFTDIKVLRILNLNALSDQQFAMYDGLLDNTREGFKWFVENRPAYSMDRRSSKLDFSKNDNGPRDRRQVHYKAYMEALNPELQNMRSEQKKENSDSNVLFGTVINHENKKLVVKLERGKTIKIHFSKVKLPGGRWDFNQAEKLIPLNSKVEVTRLQDDPKYGPQYQAVVKK